MHKVFSFRRFKEHPSHMLFPISWEARVSREDVRICIHLHLIVVDVMLCNLKYCITLKLLEQSINLIPHVGVSKMSVSALIPLHVALGELVALSALWMGVELLERPSEARMKRVLAAALILAVTSWLSYIVGGHYYVVDYPSVRSVIVEGPMPWAHKVLMEAKEHIFLAGPYIATAVTAVIYAFRRELIANEALRRTLLISFAIIFVGVALVLGFGVGTSLGYRAALAGG